MLRVTSEVGRLRQVLCHSPGREVDGMIPDMMEELLFDDILHGDDARAEHARLRRVLELLGIEVLEAEQLLAEALNDEAARQWVVRELLSTTPSSVRDAAANAPPVRLAELLVGGQRARSPDIGVSLDELYAIPPLPNYCFQRDPQSVIGDKVAIHAMASSARARESLLARVIFGFHPRFGDDRLLMDSTAMPGEVLRRSAIEGGDVLVLSEDVVVVGLSQRTNHAGINLLADGLARGSTQRWLVIVEVPTRRAYMHLDTLFTPVDNDACLHFPPVIAPGGALNSGVFLIDLHKSERSFVSRPDLFSTLKDLGIDYEPIACGGADPVAQQREQWTDGANAMALAPGVITVYNRNRATTRELARHGFDIVDAEDLLLGRVDLDLEKPRRCALLVPSNELSRARGGPHCLLHSLVRDDA
jgi:arginine deiminase